MNKSKYPNNWLKIAEQLKKEKNYTCERCKHRHEPDKGYTITVHHLDGNPSNCKRWNLAVLCQRCHLKVQAYVKLHNELEQMNFPFYEPAEWLIPHLRGYVEERKKEKGEI